MSGQCPIRTPVDTGHLTGHTLAMASVWNAGPEALAAILDTVGEGIIAIDVEEKIRLINQEAAQIFGYQKQELLGRPIHLLMPEHLQQRHHRGFKEALEAHAWKPSRSYRTLEGKRKNGQSFPLELRFTEVEVEGERFFTASTRDISFRLAAQQELKLRAQEIERLNQALAHERDYLREEVHSQGGFDREFVGESSALKRVIAQIEAVAQTDATVLILGESGVGKELVARSIHKHSQREKGPLVKVNCASIPRELFESEFFGHRRGAFTGAVSHRVGRFQLAQGGTIFLDEIGEIPIELQGKLLRVLQEQEFEAVGADTTSKVDIRVVGATNRDLLQDVHAGKFREDLYYRLSVFPISVPPLRQRIQDILPLAGFFLDRAAHKLRRPQPRLSPTVAKLLERYPWPGNIRELQNIMERACILCQDGWLKPNHLGLPQKLPVPESSFASPMNYLEPRPQLSKERIEAVLLEHDWVIKRAATALGLSRQALYRRMEKYQLKKPEF